MSGHDDGRVTGADKEAESDDPMMLAAAFVPGGLDAMSEAVVEEYSQMGMTTDEIFELFKSPFYAATHRYYRLRGEAETVAMIARVIERAPVLRYRYERGNHE